MKIHPLLVAVIGGIVVLVATIIVASFLGSHLSPDPNAHPCLPWDWNACFSEGMSNSTGIATSQLRNDPSLVAACHMEYWENTTRAQVSYESDGIRAKNMTDLNYVCYYRDGHVEVARVSPVRDYMEAALMVSTYYRGYQGNVYVVEGVR
jgi:hypothetical protein